MTGSIVEVRCVPGDAVEQGEVLLVIESMKMNNELRSPATGTVEAVPVEPGQKVDANELLVSLRTGEA
jgi:biotin carboxyl carrier protein